MLKHPRENFQSLVNVLHFYLKETRNFSVSIIKINAVYENIVSVYSKNRKKFIKSSVGKSY
jgi:hypothetical protein